MELRVTNASSHDIVFEDCLHTYFSVGDISQVAITGLKGLQYIDKVENFARKQESGEACGLNGKWTAFS